MKYQEIEKIHFSIIKRIEEKGGFVSTPTEWQHDITPFLETASSILSDAIHSIPSSDDSLECHYRRIRWKRDTLERLREAASRETDGIFRLEYVKEMGLRVRRCNQALSELESSL
jgi:hypothetical protein